MGLLLPISEVLIPLELSGGTQEKSLKSKTAHFRPVCCTVI